MKSLNTPPSDMTLEQVDLVASAVKVIVHYVNTKDFTTDMLLSVATSLLVTGIEESIRNHPEHKSEIIAHCSKQLDGVLIAAEREARVGGGEIV